MLVDHRSTGDMPEEEVQRPDDWPSGLHMGVKALNTKSVARATTPDEVILVCAQHDLRKGNEGHRHRFPIVGSHRNSVLIGSHDPWVIADIARNILSEFGISPDRRDNIMAIEAVFQPPEGWDCHAFWTACIAWVKSKYQHILFAVVHRDQKRPHMHVLMLAVHDGKLAGNDLTSDANRAPLQRREWLAYMRRALDLRPDRTPPRSFDDIMTGIGVGKHQEPTPMPSCSQAAREVGMGVEFKPDRPPCPDPQYCVELSTEDLQQKEARQNIAGSTVVTAEPASEVDYLRAEVEMLRTDLRDLTQVLEDVMRCHAPAAQARPTSTAPIGDVSCLAAARADEAVCFGIASGAPVSHARPGFLAREPFDVWAPVPHGLTPAQVAVAHWIATNCQDGAVSASRLRKGRGAHVGTLELARLHLGALEAAGLLRPRRSGSMTSTVFLFDAKVLRAALAGESVAPVRPEPVPILQVDAEQAEPLLAAMDGRGWLRVDDAVALNVPGWRDPGKLSRTLATLRDSKVVQYTRGTGTTGRPPQLFRFDSQLNRFE